MGGFLFRISNQSCHLRLSFSLLKTNKKKSSQNKTYNNHSQHIHGQWCCSKTFTSYVNVCFSALILALSALWPRSFPSRLCFLFFFLFCNWRKSWNLAQFHLWASERYRTQLVTDFVAWPRHVTGTTNHLRIILICLKGIDTVVFLLFLFCFFGRPKSKQKFWHPSQRISWEKIICQPCCVCSFPYEYVCPVAPNHWPLWARILLVTFKIGTQLLSGALSNFLMTDLLWSPAAFMVGQFSEEKNLNSTFKWQLHCAIYTIDLSSVHSRCPPELVCLIFLFSCLSFMFWMLLISAKRLWNFKKKNKKKNPPYPHFSKLGFPPDHQSPWNCWENSAKRKKQLLNCVCSKLY